MKKVVVIPSTKDGAELRRAKRENKYHVVCKGRDDAQEINEALRDSQRGRLFSIGDAWNRIFRKR